MKRQVSQSEIVGERIPLKALRQQIGLMAPTNGRVLIYGESGTGKSVAARALHDCSPRARKPFVAVNCAALSETFLGRALFGHERDAFPGAVTRKEGKL